MKKNILIAALALAFISMVSMLAYNEYQFKQSEERIEVVDAQIQVLEENLRGKILKILLLEGESKQ